MFTYWKKANLFIKFGIILGALILTSCAILFTNVSITKKMEHSYVALLDHDVAIAMHADKIDILALQCRRSEKDFYLRKDKKYVKRVQDTIVLLKHEAQQVIDMTGLKSEIGELASVIIQNIDIYQDKFLAVTKAWEITGLDHKSGLQGKFRASAHDLADDLKEHQMVDLNMAFLQMRRYEKDFHRTRSEKYKKKWLSAIKTFNDLIMTRRLDPDEKEVLTREITRYQDTANSFMRLDVDEVYESIRKIAKIMENSLYSVYVHKAETMLLDIRKHEKDYLLRRDAKYVDKTLVAIEKLRNGFDNDKVAKKHLQSISVPLDAYKSAFLSLVDNDKVIKTLNAEMRAAVHKVEPQVEQIIVLAEKSRHTKQTATTMAADRTLLVTIVVSCIILLVLAIFVFIVVRSIVLSIREGVQLSEKIADGDLTYTLKSQSQDEIGNLIDSLNHMGEKLRTMFKDISSGVQTLSSASTELSAISNQMSANSEQTTGKANAVAAAAEEMSVNMDSVAAASEETSVNVNMVAAAAEEMSTTITEIATNTEKTQSITETAVSQSQNASTQINELGAAAQEIGKVTETITEISEQTNLLALNATIEAARAGEAGKGFAVVANEIKDLAKQTSEATAEIKDKISKIQDATRTSVTEITQITGVISEVNEMVSIVSVTVEEQSNATQEIADNISQASQGIQEVNENVAQASSATGEVAADIAEVGQASSEINVSSTQVNVSADELSELAGKLTGIVNQFKV
jgi:methyl-accepting chemotaxis protein